MKDETPSTELTVTARAALALGSDKARTELAELVKKSANILEVKNAAGRDECHSAAMALVKARATIEKIGKAARDDATKFSKAVIAEEKALIDITQPEETRLLALRNAWDEARAAEKAEAERIERERVMAIHARIADIKAMGTLAQDCRTSAMVESLIDKLMALPVEGFAEFEAEAANARGQTLARMKEISDQKVAEEQKERERIAAEVAAQAERDRLAAEQAARDAEAKALQEKADAERRAQVEAQAAELAWQRAAMAEENARINAELERARAAQAAEAAKLAEERAAIERERMAAMPKPAPLPEPAIQMIELAPAKRPTDIQIIEALAAHFNVPEALALSWLIDLDVESALDVYESATA